MRDFESMSAQELVVFAEEIGLSREILGMTVTEIRATLKELMPDSATDESLASLSWVEIKRLAKEKGISVYKKKRSEIEAMLTKETVEKTEVEEKEVEQPELGEPTTSAAFENLWQAIADIHHRIDLIVAAIEKSKSVKGL